MRAVYVSRSQAVIATIGSGKNDVWNRVMEENETNRAQYSVDFALNVEGRGLVALCCFPYPPTAELRAGDAIDFVRPDGSILRTTVRALDMVMDARPGLLGLVLPSDVTKEDIPQGTMLAVKGTEGT